MNHYTYLHTRNDTGAVFYIGKGSGSRAHAEGRNEHWNRVVAKYGYTVHILAKWETEKEAFEHEKFLILCFKDLGAPLTNMTDGGDGGNTTGGRAWVHNGIYRLMVKPEEAEDLISRGWVYGSGVIGRKDIGSLYRGIPKSDEAKAKISKTLTGRKLPEAHIAAISKAQTGSKRSEEAKANISKSLIGEERSEQHCRNLSKGKLGKVVVNNGDVEKRILPEELQAYMLEGWARGLLKVTCPVCNKVGGRSHMTRFHFDNCERS